MTLANHPVPNFTGADLSARVNAGLLELPGERGLSARAFGARGDGATNDTAPLLAWMAAAAGGGALYLPAGTYVFRRGTGPLQPDTILASNVTVCGNGAASVIAGLYMRRTSVYLNGCARTRASKSQFLNHMFAV